MFKKILSLIWTVIFSFTLINNSFQNSNVETTPELVRVNQSYQINGKIVLDSSDLINGSKQSIPTSSLVINPDGEWNMVTKNIKNGTMDFFFFDEHHYSYRQFAYPYTKENSVNAVLADFAKYNETYGTNLIFVEVDRYETCPIGTYKVALVSYNRDYHWYRQDSDGYWSHKRGYSVVERYDYSNNIIIDPYTADRGRYTNFLGYFAVSPWGNMYVE